MAKGRSKLSKRTAVEPAVESPESIPVVESDEAKTDDVFALAKPYDIVAVNTIAERSNAPVMGKSYYIVLDKERASLNLFHPFTFTKFSMGAAEFRQGLSENDWKPTAEKLVKFLENKAATLPAKREVPVCAKLIINHFKALI